jgi:NADPH-dependent 2,4-dienoyl-CoA reductase/sulfur reductase-like enzyme
MRSERLLVIGGVAAGMSAASRARRLDPNVEIVVLEKGQDVSYGACGLPYLISGRVADAADLVVHNAEYFRKERGIEVRLGHKAVSIEPGFKLVVAETDQGQRAEIHYDKLVIATGGAPAQDILGSDRANVFTCNDLASAVRLRAFLEREKPQRAVIAGSGYIGLEFADALRSRGLDVTILERSEAALDGVDAEITAEIERVLAAHAVVLKKNAAVSQIAGPSGGLGTSVQFGLAGGIPADLVILSTGIRPRTELAESAEIALGRTGAIAVDDAMRTNVHSIFAAGDCTEVQHIVTGAPAYFPLGTTANKQGRVAGENAAGGRARFPGIVGTLVTKVFELELARTGLSTEQARAHGFSPQSVAITSISKAKYFQGKPLFVKLIWDQPTSLLLGCQMLGEDGAAKRIDVAAMALHARMRVPDLVDLDLGYAPPFAPVWEPILIAANEAMKKIGRT